MISELPSGAMPSTYGLSIEASVPKGFLPVAVMRQHEPPAPRLLVIIGPGDHVPCSSTYQLRVRWLPCWMSVVRPEARSMVKSAGIAGVVHEADAFGEQHGVAVDRARLRRPLHDIHRLADVLEQRLGFVRGDVISLRQEIFAARSRYADRLARHRHGDQQDVVVGPAQVSQLLIARIEAGDDILAGKRADRDELLAVVHDGIGEFGAVGRNRQLVQRGQPPVSLQRRAPGRTDHRDKKKRKNPHKPPIAHARPPSPPAPF
ncbi:MAG: hypothetical protein WDN08_21180 [Rhizomicrobium sp.]